MFCALVLNLMITKCKTGSVMNLNFHASSAMHRKFHFDL